MFMSLVKIIKLCLLLCVCLLVGCDHKSSSQPLSVMTFNIENGGTQISFDKIVEAINKSNADIVGIQEPWGNIPRLAQALGWKYYDKRQHIVSRFPLYEPTNHLCDFVEVSPGKMVVVANIHLPSDPYGPDLIMQKRSQREIRQNEIHLRQSVALPYIKQMAAYAKQGIPVFLTGDFNSPSHQDWTAATINKLPAHRFAISWPVTESLVKSGLHDSYRDVNPDVLKNPGETWPAARMVLKNNIDHFNPGANDIPARIDFIFFGGDAKATESLIAGEQNKFVDPWPSDHRAVVSRFIINPAIVSKEKLTVVNNQLQLDKPSIHVSKKSISQGESLKISWKMRRVIVMTISVLHPLICRNSPLILCIYTRMPKLTAQLNIIRIMQKVIRWAGTSVMHVNGHSSLVFIE